MRLPNPGLKEFALAAFLMAGYFKSDPRLAWVPVDLTLGLALCLAGAIGWKWLRQRRVTVPRATVLLVAFFAVLSLSLLEAGISHYARDKATRLFSLTLLSGLAPPLLLETEAEVRRFLRSLALLGAVMASDGAIMLMTSTSMERLNAFNSDTISLGRATGMAFVWVCGYWLERRVGMLLGLVTLTTLAAVMLASGTRAALLACGITLVITFVALYRSDPRVVGRLALGLCAMVAALVLAYPFLPQESVARVKMSLSGEVDASAEARIRAYSDSGALIAEHPLGIGLGNFPDRVPMMGGDAWLVYPHNMLVEVALEAGLPAAALLVALVGLALFRLARAARATGLLGGKATFSFLVFFAVNVMFSGDLNDNKAFIALLGLSLCAEHWLGTPRLHPGEELIPTEPTRS